MKSYALVAIARAGGKTYCLCKVLGGNGNYISNTIGNFPDRAELGQAQQSISENLKF